MPDRQAAADRHSAWAMRAVAHGFSARGRRSGTPLTSLPPPAVARSVAIVIIQFTVPGRGGIVGAGCQSRYLG